MTTPFKPAAAPPPVSPIARHPALPHGHGPASAAAPKERRLTTVSLRWILIFALTTLGIAPIAFYMISFVPKARAKIESDTRVKQAQTAPSATALIDSSLAGQERDLRQIAAVFAMYNGRADRKAKVAELLTNQFLSRSLTQKMPYLAYLDENGSRLFEARPQGAQSGLSQNPALAAALDSLQTGGAGNFTDKRIVKAGRDGYRLIRTPIRSGSDSESQAGSLIGLFDLSDLSATLSEQFQGGDMGFALILKNGDVLLHGGGAVATTIGESLKDDPLFTHFRAADGSLPRGVLNVRDLERTAASGSQKLLVTYAPTGTGDLGLIILSDQRYIFKETDELQQKLLWLGGFIALIAILTGLILAQIVLGPVNSLQIAARTIAGGDFNAPVPRSLFSELDELGGNFRHMEGEVQRLIGDLSVAADTNKKLFIGTVRAIANALDAKDPYTRGHSERVARYAKVLAQEHGLPAVQVELCEISALLHDIGKVGVEDAILRKPAALTDAEFEIMKQHPGRGSQILGAIAEMKDIIPGVRGHHERWSGGGYPDNLAGEKIAIQARLVSVADTLDAMTTERPYQKAMSMTVSAARINLLAGKSFDPAVVESFNRAYQKGLFTATVNEKKLIIPKNRPQVA